MAIIKKMTKVPFPQEIKKIFKKNVKKCKVGIEYINANVIDIDIFNISILSLAKIILFKNDKLVEILYSNQGLIDNYQFFLQDLSNPINIDDIIDIINDMA